MSTVKPFMQGAQPRGQDQDGLSGTRLQVGSGWGQVGAGGQRPNPSAFTALLPLALPPEPRLPSHQQPHSTLTGGPTALPPALSEDLGCVLLVRTEPAPDDLRWKQLPPGTSLHPASPWKNSLLQNQSPGLTRLGTAA